MRDALQWMGYCALVSALLMGGAVAMEAALRAAGRSTRWAWFAAIVGSLVFPFVSYFKPVHVPYAAADIAIGVLAAAPPAGAPAALPAPGHHMGLILWATSFVLVLAFIVYSYVRLMHARRAWTRSEIDGTPVWLSEDVGPAALGVTQTHIVLPRWVLALEKRAIDLMMLHEREHLRAGDPRLMLASIVAAGALPWNPFGWLMLRRLRLAIELDCDARVLAREPDATAYGAVLLEVGRRRATRSFAMSTFAEPRSELEVRIRRMAELPRRRAAVRAAVLTIGALAFATAAYAMRAPMHGRVVMDPPHEAAHIAPTATMDTVAPVLRNADDVRREINRLYPPRLRDAGIEGTSTIAVFVSSSGKVTDTKLAVTSGQDLMDDAALRAAATMVFTPAVHQGRRIGMLMMVRIPFRATVTGPEIIAAGSSVRVRPPTVVSKKGVVDTVFAKKGGVVDTVIHLKKSGVVDTVITLRKSGVVDTVISAGKNGVVDTVMYIRKNAAPPTVIQSEKTNPMVLRGAPAAQPTDPGDPFITPMDIAPRLKNRQDVGQAIQRAYPVKLRESGIGGTATVWMFIDLDGRVTKSLVKKTSGNALIDAAALRVAPQMTFEPAQANGKQIPVWVALDVMFHVK